VVYGHTVILRWRVWGGERVVVEGEQEKEEEERTCSDGALVHRELRVRNVRLALAHRVASHVISSGRKQCCCGGCRRS
jgi:hypothetical protein